MTTLQNALLAYHIKNDYPNKPLLGGTFFEILADLIDMPVNFFNMVKQTLQATSKTMYDMEYRMLSFCINYWLMESAYMQNCYKNKLNPSFELFKEFVVTDGRKYALHKHTEEDEFAFFHQMMIRKFGKSHRLDGLKVEFEIGTDIANAMERAYLLPADIKLDMIEKTDTLEERNQAIMSLCTFFYATMYKGDDMDELSESVENGKMTKDEFLQLERESFATAFVLLFAESRDELDVYLDRRLQSKMNDILQSAEKQ